MSTPGKSCCEGKICQAKGEKDRALGYYKRFLEIWSLADAGLPAAGLPDMVKPADGAADQHGQQPGHRGAASASA